MSPLPARSLLTWLALTPNLPDPEPAGLTAADWDELFSQAYRHGVTAQLYRRVRAEAAGGAVPRAALQAIWLAAITQQKETARFQRELPGVLDALRARGVTPILLKGAHLTSTVYAEPVLRPLGDFDLLVPVPELAAAEQALREKGYVSDRHESIAEVCAREHGLPSLHLGAAYPVELHWTLAHPNHGIRVDVDGLWERSEAVAIGGEAARVLAPEDALLHVCLHGAVLHLFDHGLRPLLDVGALVDRHGATLDWSALEARARAWGVERAVFLLLALARRDAAVAVPDSVLARAQSGGVTESLLDAALVRMLEVPGPMLGGVATRSLAMAYANPRAALQSVFSTNTTLASQYRRAGRTPRYFVARLKDLFQRYGRVAWQLARRNNDLRHAAAGRLQSDIALRRWLGIQAASHKPVTTARVEHGAADRLPPAVPPRAG